MITNFQTIFFLFGTLAMAADGSFVSKKYELTVTPDFNEKTFIGKVIIHVEVSNSSVRSFELSAPKDLEIERISFFQAAHIFRGHPQYIGQTVDFNVTDNLQVSLLNDVTSESIKEGGYVEVDFKGNMENFEKNTWEVKNALNIFPILQDTPSLITLSVITPYRAGVEVPSLTAGEHKDVFGKELISNNFNSGDKKIRVSEVSFKVNGPTVLVLDN